MILKRISLTNYKNIASASLSFSDKLNCIVGSNGMGKTNLLDSVYYLSFTRPNIFIPDSMVISHGSEIAVIEGEYNVNGKSELLYMGLRQDKGKVLKRNKKPYAKISDHIGLFPLVMVSPDDSGLITGGSIERRKFMDQIICQESRPYLLASIQYKRLLEQRNSLLKNEYGIDLSVLAILDEQLATSAVTIMKYRIDWLERIRPIFMDYYHFITDSAEQVSLSYEATLTKEGDEYQPEDFINAWKSSFERDKALGYTTIGPHRDDLLLLLDDYLIRKIGSQGQAKSYLIALKFAQFALLRQLHPHNTPILLLDDIFDKLDEHRVDRIVNLVAGDDFGQIFMTDTNRKYLDQILKRLPEEAPYAIFRVENGVISAL